MNYLNQENALGERMSTNGYYTGEHKGAVTQDALENADNNPYFVERTTERMGTITQDAASGSTPGQAFRVTYDLNGAEGTLAIASEVASNGNKVKAAKAPTITKYPDGKQAPFTKWNTEAAGTGTGYDVDTDVTLTKDIVLYAQYTATE